MLGKLEGLQLGRHVNRNLKVSLIVFILIFGGFTPDLLTPLFLPVFDPYLLGVMCGKNICTLYHTLVTDAVAFVKCRWS